MKKILILFVLAVSVMLAGCANIANTGNSNTIETGYKYDSFAKCLTSKGIKMYGTNWCGYCNMQKGYFNESFKYIDFVDCEENRDECQQAGIEGYPTWIIDGEKSPGAKPLEKLAELTGCQLPA